MWLGASGVLSPARLRAARSRRILDRVRILVATTANVGHFAPVVPLARALIDAGHEVQVAAARSFASTIEGASLTAAPFDDPAPADLEAVYRTLPRPDSGLSDEAMRDLSNLIMVRDVFGTVDARAALPGIRAIVDRWRPDLIVREPAEIASLVTAEAMGIRHVQYGIGTVAILRLMADGMAEPLATLEAENGLDQGSLAAAAVHAPLFTPAPGSFDSQALDSSGPVEIHRFRLPPAAGGGDLPVWGDADAPLAVVSFGSVAASMAQYADLYRGALDALADAPVRVLLTTGRAGSPDALRPWPSNAHVETWWPLDAAMAEAHVLVGHGGFGTTLSALMAGVPQVVIPLFATDQWINAVRVDAIDAGIALVDAFEATRLREAVARAGSDPTIHAGVAAVRRDIAGLPSAADLVPALTAR